MNYCWDTETMLALCCHRVPLRLHALSFRLKVTRKHGVILLPKLIQVILLVELNKLMVSPTANHYRRRWAFLSPDRDSKPTVRLCAVDTNRIHRGRRPATRATAVETIFCEFEHFAYFWEDQYLKVSNITADVEWERCDKFLTSTDQR